uniref:Putative enspm-8 hm n=1 Tax=Xenopsylla cheopis TaxID=163159 RepID=A0A6M2DZT2_XENCH
MPIALAVRALIRIIQVAANMIILVVASNLINLVVKNYKVSPFVIGIYYGDSKPENIDVYLHKFIEEINNLYDEGFTYKNIINRVRIKKNCCDAPARAFIKCIKGHNGYYACERCTQQGVRIDNKVVYPNLNNTLRKHESFSKYEYKDHQLRLSPLLNIKGINVISDINLDYMHMACLGVMKKLLKHWIKERKHANALTPSVIKCMSAELENMASMVPCEFQRKPRGFDELDRWKATEYRFFMLYAGPIVLKDYISKQAYIKFLNFHVAMRIICSDRFIKVFGRVASECIENFCVGLRNLYGEEFLEYNMHSIYHMVNDAITEKLNVNDVSSFPFENFLGQILKLVRGPAKPLQQIARRLTEMCEIEDCKPSGFHAHIHNNKIKFMKINGFKIYPNKTKDSHILLPNDQVMCVELIYSENSDSRNKMLGLLQ